jgi:hypothetical protein
MVAAKNSGKPRVACSPASAISAGTPTAEAAATVREGPTTVSCRVCSDRYDPDLWTDENAFLARPR